MKIHQNEVASNLLIILVWINLVVLFDNSLFKFYETHFKFFYLIIIVIVFFIINIKISIKKAAIFLILVLYFGITVTAKGMGFDSTITIISSVLSVYCFSRFSINYKKMVWLFRGYFVLYLFAFFNSFTYYHRWQMYSMREWINPNTYGMFIFYASVFFDMYIRIRAKKYIKTKQVVLYLGSIFILWQYESRTMLAVFLIYLIISRIILNQKFREQIKKKIMILLGSIIILGTAFPFVYCKLADYLYSINFSNYFMGKDVFTRYAVWKQFLDYLQGHGEELLFGFGLNGLETSVASVHNNYLIIIGYGGIVGIVLYYLFVLYVTRERVNSITFQYEFCYLLGFILIFLIGFTEVSSFWLPLYPIQFILIGKIEISRSEVIETVDYR